MQTAGRPIRYRFGRHVIDCLRNWASSNSNAIDPKALAHSELRLSRLTDRLLQRVDHAAKLIDHPVVYALGIHLEQRFVVPEV